MTGDDLPPQPAPDDGELLRRYATARSEEAFAALVERHLRLVYNVALRKVGGDAQLAEDVAQRVFADLASKAAALRRHPAITGWLFTGAHHAAAQLVRTERRRKAREQESHAMNEALGENEPAIDWAQLRPLLDDLLLELPERDREAVLMRYFEDRPFAEVGERLELTDHGARARVERAVDKLRTRLARRGVTSTSAALGLALAHQAGVAAPAGLAASVTGAALATSAAATGAMTAGFLTFMSTTKTTVAVATLVTLSAIGFGLFQWADKHTVVAEAVTLRQERDALAAQVARNAPPREAPRAAPTERVASAAPAGTPAAISAAAPSAPALTVARTTPPTLEDTKEALSTITASTGKVTMDSGHIANIRAWAERDADGLIRWITTLPEARRQREHALEAVIAVETETNPELAFLFAGGIAREVARSNRRSEVLRSWAPRDYAAAANAVATADLTPDERKRLTALVQVYSRMQPPESRVQVK